MWCFRCRLANWVVSGGTWTGVAVAAVADIGSRWAARVPASWTVARKGAKNLKISNFRFKKPENFLPFVDLHRYCCWLRYHQHHFHRLHRTHSGSPRLASVIWEKNSLKSRLEICKSIKKKFINASNRPKFAKIV